MNPLRWTQQTWADLRSPYEAFHRAGRRRLASLVGGGVVTAVAVAVDAYRGQSPWHTLYAEKTELYALALSVSAVGALVLLWAIASRRLKSLVTPLALAILTLGWVASLRVTVDDRPTQARGWQAVRAGDWERARAEVDGLTRRGEASDAGSLVDTIHMHDLNDTRNLADTLRLLRTPWLTQDARTTAYQRVDASVLSEALRAWRAGTLATLEALLRQTEGVELPSRATVAALVEWTALEQECARPTHHRCPDDAYVAARHPPVPEALYTESRTRCVTAMRGALTTMHRRSQREGSSAARLAQIIRESTCLTRLGDPTAAAWRARLERERETSPP